MMKVTVWTKAQCPQCDMTKKVMKREGIEFEEMSLEAHPLVLSSFKDQGFLGAPIVRTDTKTWSGFRLDKIKSLASHLFGEKK
jgi:glutaredoxin-like protein NrdH